MRKLAPVVIFAYNRVNSIEKLICSLEQNEGIDEIDLYIFVDIPAKRKPKKGSDEVQCFLKEYATISKFNEVIIEVAQSHKGLANSVIDGVTKVINKYGKVIVLEDDLLVSIDYISYMQKALDFYEKDQRIWSVTGNTESFNALNNYSYDVYLSMRGNSLGWGTWKDRWMLMDWKVSQYRFFRYNIFKRLEFNKTGNDMSQMLDRQMKGGKLDSWAIRWCFQQFLLHKATVYPKSTRVIVQNQNYGAIHGGYKSTMNLSDSYKECKFAHVGFDREITKEFKYVYAPTYLEMIKNRLCIKKH